MSILDARSHNPLAGGPSFTLRNRCERALWNAAWALLAMWTPTFAHRWRRLLLTIFGAKLHPTVRIYPTAKIWYPKHLIMGANSVFGPRVNCYCMAMVTIGSGAIISQGAHICAGTHDISDKNFQLIARPIVIGQDAWIAAEAFIGPGVNIGSGAVVGARAVLFKDALPMGVYVGNPAQLIKNRVFNSVAGKSRHV